MPDKKIDSMLEDRMKLFAVFARQTRNKKRAKHGKEVCSMDDFDKIKVIGRGGFAEKVYLARKKDTGALYAIKTMSKEFILEE